jgi:hypothetical protein
MSDARLKPMALAPVGELPLVSILVANYGYAGYLDESIGSALGQTYRNIEVVVCDDGSRDHSVAVLEGLALADSRIRLVLQANAGQAAALNSAYAASRGAILCILDADDRFHPEKVARVVEAFARNPRAGLATHRVQLVDGAGRRERRRPIPEHLERGWAAGRAIALGLAPDIPPASGLSLRREVAERIFPLPRQFRQLADGYAGRAAVLITEVAAIDGAWADYRIHCANLTGLTASSAVELRRQNDLLEPFMAELCRWAGAVAGCPLETRRVLLSNETWLETRLALRLLEDAPGSSELRDVLRGPSAVARKLAWTLLACLPARAVERALKLWWGPSGPKRVLHALRCGVEVAAR